MRRRTKTICIGFALMIGLTASPSARAEERTPCLKIKQVCEEAGFRQNALTEGIGLQVDCIRPLIEGTKQRQAAGLNVAVDTTTLPRPAWDRLDPVCWGFL